MPFADLIGHRRLTALLSRAVSRGSLPPTLLFAGPAGVGKWRVALATAQAVNCLEPVRHARPDAAGSAGAAPPLECDACGRCRSCDRIARGMHVDVIALEPDDRASIKIDLVRDVLSRSAYRPFEGQRRVVLIRNADTLEKPAQHALLKSLEEPPPGTMFVLTTAVPGALLPTVRSRCMRLTFGRLTAAEVSSALVRDHGMNDADARATAPLADGSVGQALALANEDMAAMRESALRMLRQTSGRADVQARIGTADALVAGPSKKERTREDVSAVLRAAASLLRDIEAINAGADGRILANPSVAGELSTLAGAFTGDRARAAFTAVDRALMALDRNAGTKLVVEWLAVQL